MYTLGIETSCDETSCAVLHGFKVLANVTISSLNQHKKYGGVVPEVATRAHLKNIDKVFLAALREAKISLKQIDILAVTHKPGLIGALVVGLNFAKALSLALNRPLIGVDHLRAHLFAAFLDNTQKIKFPFIGLVVSGGHTDIYLVRDFDRLKLIGATQDDACGESYDKVARVLGLGYPGGPVIDKMFDERQKNAFKFKCGRREFDLSFSGIKTAVLYKKQELEGQGVLQREDLVKLVSSFQGTAVEAITDTVCDAALKYKVGAIVCGGGVAANRYLRARLIEKAVGLKVRIAPMRYTTDNAAMVAGLGFYLYNKGFVNSLKLKGKAS
jgi:N6-L-threonylcarbamoyladenine synthase